MMPANGGCEGCESAVKFARRWGYYVKGVEKDKADVIMANNNFWGRSIAASGSCNDPSRYLDFGPHAPGFTLVDYNDL
jgi:ornithine--oxo-acid transaminase